MVAKDVQSVNVDASLSKEQDQARQGISDLKRLAPHLEAQAAPEQSQERGGQAAFSSDDGKESSGEARKDFLSRWPPLRQPGQVVDSRSAEVTLPDGVPGSQCEICHSLPGTMCGLFSSCPICGGLKVSLWAPGVPWSALNPV